MADEQSHGVKLGNSKIANYNSSRIVLPFFQGESDPIPLDVHCTHEQQILSRNMAFGHATFVIRGSGKAVVTRTGINTIMGETADLTAANAKADTLITR